MKKIFGFTAILLCSLLLLPLTAFKNTEKVIPVLSQSTAVTEAESFRICNAETEKVEEISTEDYIFGVVAAEMPALYEPEALKAQAVAAYTFALYRKQANQNNDYDLTDSHLSDQSYITLEQAKERWGDNADEYVNKIRSAVADVKDYAIIYQNQPILAVYHAISYGTTEDAKNIWGGDYPYLKPVDSYGDKLCKDYISTLSVTAEEFKQKLSGKTEFTDSPENYLGKITRTDSGTVKKIEICGKEISGDSVREIFSLRSANFETEYKDGNFNFTVYGYGHSIGLSQNGANFLAKQGADFKEILNHYYKNCEIKKIK